MSTTKTDSPLVLREFITQLTADATRLADERDALRAQLDTEKAEHIEKDNLLKQSADVIAAQACHIRDLQAEFEAQRTTTLGALLGALLAMLLLAAVITGAVTAVPKHPSVAPPAVSECLTDSECEGLPVMKWEADV